MRMIRHSIDLLGGSDLRGVVIISDHEERDCGACRFGMRQQSHEHSIVHKVHSLGGGITLNHLSWAQILNVPTGLLAIQVGGETRA